MLEAKNVDPGRAVDLNPKFPNTAVEYMNCLKAGHG
jgi:hypothetical protein